MTDLQKDHIQLFYQTLGDTTALPTALDKPKSPSTNLHINIRYTNNPAVPMHNNIPISGIGPIEVSPQKSWRVL
jgi:hypothetical protein